MSSTEGSESATPDDRLLKRKREDAQEIEIDVDAPEPPSKKALRRAKKTKLVAANGTVPDVPASSTGTSRSEYGIWIGNLNFSTTKEDIHAFVTGDKAYPIEANQITRIHIPASNPKHGAFQNKGFAYVDFVEGNTVATALQLSEKLLGGRRVLIKGSKDFAGRPERSASNKQATAPSRKLFVGNLGFDVATEELRQHFEQAGQVEDIHMATFEDSGKCKGYAWITFDGIPSATTATRGWAEVGQSSDRSTRKRVWLNRMKGRTLRMEYAEDATTRYNKRFGKKTGTETDSPGGYFHNDVEPQEASTAKQRGHTSKAPSWHESRMKELSGSHLSEPERVDVSEQSPKFAVISQGKKTTFD